jgi:mannan endo-1,4-beta-mannosidase
MTTADIDELGSTGLDCIVGEFGDTGSDGHTEWDQLVNYAKSKAWPVFGWAWNGDGEGMNMIQPKPFQALVTGTSYPYTTDGYFDKIYSLL